MFSCDSEDGVSVASEVLAQRHARRCICCMQDCLRTTPAVLMPFVAKRVFNHEPIEITADWGLNDLRPGWAYSLCNTLECKLCGVIFLDYRFSDAEMSLLYDNYRDEEYNATRIRFEPGYVEPAAHYEGRARYISSIEEILAPYLPERPCVLDWGGGTGSNSPFRFRCEELHIYDISRVNVCDEAKNLSLEECLGRSYDLIACMQVLEHVPHPINLLSQIRSAMRPSTLLYLEVPFERIFRDNKEEKFLGDKKRHWHEHVNFFSPASLEAVAKYCGLEVVLSKTLDVSLGWRESVIQMLVCKRGAN